MSRTNSSGPPQKLEDVFSGTYFIAAVQSDYYLSAADYWRLKSGWVSLYGWALNVGFATFGYALSAIPKVYSNFENKVEPYIAMADWVPVAIGMILVVALSVAGKCMPSDRKRVLKSMDEHFSNSPITRQPFRGEP
ncbi:hypothetical protein N7668_09820 [Pseudomonas fulva]|uniref:hypothetical protein n=1 Tax=Pseudomonas fulva TaxID=47880 RepID=UPI0024479770|nr:hypothetical protein [Pseudomonas fulva]MDH0571547.1 hypothetical protein [Pseudomonas fulva]